MQYSRSNFIKQLFFTFFLLLYMPAAFGQDTSMQRFMEMPDDTLKVQAIFKYARTVGNNDPAKARVLYESALDVSRKVRYWDGVGTILMNLGALDGQGGKYPESIVRFRSALPHFERINKRKGVGTCLLNIGSAYESMGKRDSAIFYYIKATSYLENTPYYFELAMLYRNIGNLFANNWNHAKGLAYTEKAIALARSHQENKRMAEPLVLALVDKSMAYQKKNKKDSALSAAYEAEKLAKSQQDSYVIATATENLSKVLLMVNKIDSSISQAKNAIDYSLKHNLTSNYISSIISLSAGLDKEGQQEKRIELLREALQKTRGAKAITMQDDLFDHLADASYKLGRYKDAFHYLDQYIKLHDTIFTQERAKNIADIEARYQTVQKEKALSEKQLQLAQKEVLLQRSRQLSLYSITATVITLLMALLVFLHYKNKRRLHQKQLVSIQQEKEIQLLQAVMQGEEKERSRIAKDLHDGVAGMLAATKMHINSIALHVGGVLQTEGYQQGIRLLDEAAQEVRKTSHNLMPEVLLQHGLDEALRRYCANISNSSKLVVQYDTLGEPLRYKDGFELSVYRIVQELLNNIVKHSKASEAIVQASFQNGLLFLTIEDNGIGMSKDSLQSDGMGLRSLTSRVKAINGKIELEAVAGQGVNAYLEFETAGLQKAIMAMA